MNEEKRIPEIAPPEGVSIRYTVAQDAASLKRWLQAPEARHSFPMNHSSEEIDDAVRRWISFSRMKSSLTLEYNGKSIGIATLYMQSYSRMAHQVDFGIILDKDFRGKGIGAYLLSCIMKLAKQSFRIELIHLQVQENNSTAIRLYTSFGFKEFGRQSHWIKNENGTYEGRIFMERSI